MKYEIVKILFCDKYDETKTFEEVIYTDGESVEAMACDTDMFRLFSTICLFLTSVIAHS